MTKEKSQRERIIDKLNEDGEITSVWAVRTYPAIFRLSERIRELEARGWIFNKHFVVVDGKRTQSYRYEVVYRPALTLGV